MKTRGVLSKPEPFLYFIYIVSFRRLAGTLPSS